MPPELSERQRAVLGAVCEALIPRIERNGDAEGHFAADATALGAAARVEQLIATIEDPRDRRRLRMLLSVLGMPIVNLILSGRLDGVATMGLAAREAVLGGWARSALPSRRAAFQALKRLACVASYCWPDAGGSHPTWRAVGYPGPLPQPPHALEPLPALTIEADMTLDCDVAVVGSGAGGGVAAGVLAECGRSVVVLERGENLGTRDMTQVEGEMLQRGYLAGGLLMTQSGSLPILAGSCVGGGTAINYTTSFALPEATRREWDARSGLGLFSSRRFGESLERVTERSGVGTRWTTPAARDAILERGCRALGWHVDATPRNVTDCLQGLECGYCGYGCRHGAKNSTARTYLADAVRAGARVVARCAADRLLVAGGRVVGVRATVRHADGGTRVLTVRARAVVVACGAIHTPALLARSGVGGGATGTGLRLHPATALVGIFPERVEPWGGALQTRYSDEFADLEAGYGARFETAPVHFALPASGFGWGGARAFKEDLAHLAHSSIVGVLLRDRDAGHVAVGRSGLPRVHYEPSAYDLGHLRRALRGAAQVLAAAGAEEVFSLHTPPVRARPGSPGWLDRFGADMDRRGYGRCRMSFISFHQMATAAMGADRRRTVAGEDGQLHRVRGAYVADASAFPTSSGVNPMLTVMAVADHVARGIAGSW